MDQNKRKPATLGRRGLLIGAAATGAAAVAATRLLPAEADPAPVASTPVVDEPRQGYRLTPHIERYYQTAKV